MHLPKEKVKCVREQIKWKMKGTSAKEENERLRRDRKGADSAEGEN